MKCTKLHECDRAGEYELVTTCETGEYANWYCRPCETEFYSEGVLREYWDSFLGGVNIDFNGIEA